MARDIFNSDITAHREVLLQLYKPREET